MSFSGTNPCLARANSTLAIQGSKDASKEFRFLGTLRHSWSCWKQRGFEKKVTQNMRIHALSEFAEGINITQTAKVGCRTARILSRSLSVLCICVPWLSVQVSVRSSQVVRSVCLQVSLSVFMAIGPHFQTALPAVCRS